MRTQKTTINRLPITKARVNLGAVVKRVHLNGEYFILEKDGIPVAGLMDADELEDYLELRDPGVVKQLNESQQDYEAGRVRNAWDLLEELKKNRSALKSKRRVKKPAKIA